MSRTNLSDKDVEKCIICGKPDRDHTRTDLDNCMKEYYHQRPGDCPSPESRPAGEELSIAKRFDRVMKVISTLPQTSRESVMYYAWGSMTTRLDQLGDTKSLELIEEELRADRSRREAANRSLRSVKMN